MDLPVTEILCDWAYNLRFEDIPAKTIQCAKEQILSIIACIFPASRTDVCRPLYSAIREWGERQESTVIGADLKTSMRSAGMANAFAAQTLEWEDYLQSQHSGAASVPTALAVGEAVKASGKEVITALIVGNEVTGRTGRAYIHSRLFTNACPNHQIDAALVAGKLIGLDREQLMDAVGISCFPPMNQCFAGWFSHTKGMITGAPVHAGITGALLAKHGFKGFRRIIEHPDGFSNAIFERYDLEEMVKDLGKQWRTDTHSPKLYPCCGWLDALIDSALDLLFENDITWEEIDRVEVRCPTVTLLLQKPVDELLDLIEQIVANDYLTSVPLFFNSIYPLAVAIMDRKLTEEQFSRERMQDRKLHDFFHRFHFVCDPLLDVKELEEGVNAGEVTFVLKSGERLSKFTDAMRGSYLNPIDVREKLETCTSNILSDGRREEIYTAVMALEDMENISELASLVA